ncbi:formin-like protein 1 [Neophocaena asiaeorientalis asiaeorientalis]|uniref:Formin-like protein 1 n=1 Tax=Neophocaena asiaeorientalis asiaeorientalis TaxID=1706337 RepID=A0A341CRU7_NEOAA|nr:formin-like protein 1 [Neophocaena asiaeorientalis asiaeorientalis]
MGNAAGSSEQPASPAALSPKHPAAPKQPMPAAGELEERFNRVLNCMNLPPDKVQLLSQYDNEKKWELICDQERFQVKNPPEAYIQKLKSYLEVGGVSRKVAADWMSNLGFKRRVQESTQVLRELETSLRTNHIGWVQEFLNEENRGLDVLLEYLAFVQCSVTYYMESTDNGAPGSEKSKPLEQSVEDLSKGPPSSLLPQPKSRHLTIKLTPAHSRKALRNSRIISQKDDVHICIMCLRAIMNYQSGFSLVMNHPACVNEIALSLNNKNPRTKALVLELLAAVCLVRGGHDIILSAFDNFKEVCGEQHRFEKLMEYFRNEDSNIDFMVACMQFINIVVHSVENMNFRVFLQYEFTHLGLDLYLERLRLTESDKLQVQIQAYLDNVFDVGALLEDTETKNAVLEHVEELQEQVALLTERLRDAENESMAKIAELEKQLSQTRKELETLQERFSESTPMGTSRRPSEPEKVPAPAPARPSALELKVEELEEKGLIRILRGPGDAVSIEILPVAVATPSGSDAPTPRVPIGSPSPGVQGLQAGLGRNGGTGTCMRSLGTSQAGRGGRGRFGLWAWLRRGCGGGYSGFSILQDPLSVGLLLPPVCSVCPHWAWAQVPSSHGTYYCPSDHSLSVPGMKAKKPIQTKFRMPLLNWVALKPNQITGTVFTELNDEKVLQELDMSDFEQQFKTKSQGPNVDLSTLKSKASQKAPSKATLIEANRAKNLAITLRKGNLGADRICQAIETYDLQTLGLDFLELLTRFLPTEYEQSLIARFEREQRPIEELSEEDRFMLRFSRIPRLPERMNTLTFLGNFPDTAQLLMPQLNAIIAASMSIKSSDKLRQILEIVLAFGNYMNSSKRGAAYGFRLQSLDALLEMKSTDRKQTLLHYLVKVIAEKYPQLTGFHGDLHFLDKAGSVSLDSVLADVRSLQRGLELTQREFVRQDDCAVLKEFLRANSPIMDKLLADSKTAQEAYESVVEYFGENPKTTSPSMFFSLFSRFIKAYKKAEQEVEQWKKAAAAQEAGTDTPGKGEPPAPKSPPKIRRQQMDLISELKRKQQKEPLIYESDRDGAIEDIITVLKTVPFTARTGKRTSRLLCEASLGEEIPL